MISGRTYVHEHSTFIWLTGEPRTGGPDDVHRGCDARALATGPTAALGKGRPGDEVEEKDQDRH